MNWAEWAKWYDLFYSVGDGETHNEAAFYIEEAVASGGPVLEIGVGTGRIAIPLAKSGVEIVGIDASREMLAVARQKAESYSPLPAELTLAQADMRSLDLRRHDFALVMIPARTLLLADTYEDQLSTLCSAARHLRPGGRLVFNVFNPTLDLIFDESPAPVDIGEALDASTRKRFALSAINSFETGAQINEAMQVVEEIVDDGTRVTRAQLSVRLRYLFAHEIFSMLDETNLEVEAVYGAFNRSPFDEESDEMIFVATRSDDSPVAESE